jgi:arsenical pump membrane protein
VTRPSPDPPSGEPPSEANALPARWVLAGVGIAAAAVAAAADASQARAAAAQVWPPFVLVAGLLLVGLVADRDGLFAMAGRRLALLATNGTVLFVGAAGTIAVVTALLNLDTSVVFLTPVFVHAARHRGETAWPLLVAVILLSNAGSLLLPGSNLTNLIVLGHLPLSGGRFLAHMALPWVVATLVTATVVGLAGRRALTSIRASNLRRGTSPEPLSIGVGALAVLAATLLVLVLRTPALPVAAVGVAAVAIRGLQRRVRADEAWQVVGVPILIGLFGIATALGTLGRSWAGPATLLSHLDPVGTSVVAAVASVVINNLPAASLLAARVPPHPFPLLVGLDVGPNLFLSGSLAWILWWRAVRAAGATPPVRRAVLLGLVSVPLAMAASLAVLALTGSL